MKNINILIFLFLISYKHYSQNLEIEFKVSENTNDPVLATSINYKLILKDYQSVYFNENDSLNQFKYHSYIDETKKIGELTKVKLSDNHHAFIKQDFFYKNYLKDTLIFNEIILNKKVIVGEKINLIDWVIETQKDTVILGYKCQKAIAKFRGRSYEAYFSNELYQYGGPWKFDGLPGVIISVKSLDNYLVIEPQKIIKNSNSSKKIVNLYDNSIAISWSTFKKKLEEKLREQLARLKSISQDGEGGSIKITDKLEDLELPELKF